MAMIFYKINNNYNDNDDNENDNNDETMKINITRKMMITIKKL